MMLWIIILAVIVMVAIVGLFVVKRRQRQIAPQYQQGGRGQERNKIYVGNLNYRVREADLKHMFSDYGCVNNVRVVRHVKTRKSQGFAFVSFSSDSEATQALRAHGKNLQGRTMVVRLAKEK